MKIVQKRLSELKHPEKNVRMHSKKQIDEYCRSITQFGQIRPLVIDENNAILVGNGLYEALVALGRDTADCIVKTDLSEHSKYKLALADNRIFSLGVDDISVFDEIIAELNGDFDIPGYDDELLNNLIADADDVDEIIAGYGTADESSRESMARADSRYQAEEQTFTATAEEIHPAVASAPQETAPAPAAARPANAAPAAEYDTAAAQNPAETSPDPLPRRYIICPKCGEKIWV